MSHESNFAQQNDTVNLLLQQISNDLKNIANQPNSIAAFFVARQVNQRLDDVIKKKTEDNTFITALLFQATEQNNVLFIKLLLQRMERHYGKSEIYQFLEGRNEQRQALLLFAVSHNCSIETIRYLVETVALPITENVISTALFVNTTVALQYFLEQADKEDLTKNRLLRLSNIVDAYTREYGTNLACTEYKQKITTRLAKHNLTLTFEKEEVPVRPLHVKPMATSTLSQHVSEQIRTNNVIKRQEVNNALAHAKLKLNHLAITIKDIKTKQHGIIQALAQVAATQDYLTAGVIIKQGLSRTQQARLSLAPSNNFFTRGLNWFLDYLSTPTLAECQQNQRQFNKAQQTVVENKEVAQAIYQAFCKPKRLPLNSETLQVAEINLKRQKQKIMEQRKIFYTQQENTTAQIQTLYKKLQELDKQTLAGPPSSPTEEMASTQSDNNRTPTLSLN